MKRGLISAATFCCLALVAAGCGAEPTSPTDRVVSLTTTACGNASRTSGAGVIIEDGWVLSAAHVVAGAGSVEVEGDFGTEAAEIVVFDAAADLALLRVPTAEASPVQSTTARTGDEVVIAGGGPSGELAAAISRPVEVQIEAVRSQERISRIGYELDVRIQLGDSGGGVFDDEENLIGLVYGRTDLEEDRSFVVGEAAITAVRAADRTGLWECDPDEHQVVPETP